MNALFWVVVAYVSGALPFSVWVGKLALHTDIRGYGDRNPGAFNVFRAGGKLWGVVAILLDGFKGAIPIWLAMDWGEVSGWPLAAVAIAPVLGHAYSPFLGFRGGKALAVTFGIWCGLTLWFGPTVLGIALAIGLAILVTPGWAVLAGMLVLLAALAFYQPDPPLLAVWAANTTLLLWKHRDDLRHPPRVQDSPVLRRLKR
ncbi:MAG: glycerol-3-phosphate acyltransferase [Caldilineaceae bacterium]|jgi:glycerol-3-phosphate acyltransferase PlsY|nr:glycerol-3-phosphate acyltransferase [Caldilineaceae bacterium]